MTICHNFNLTLRIYFPDRNVGLFFVFVCWKCCSLKDNGVSSQQLEKDKDVEMTVDWMDNVGEVSKKTTVDKLEFNITIK